MSLDIMTQTATPHQPPAFSQAELDAMPKMKDFNLAVIGIEDKRDVALLSLVFNSLSLSDFRRFVAELEHIEATEKHHGHQINFVKKAASLYEDAVEKCGKDRDIEGEEGESYRARRENLLEQFGLSKERAKPEIRKIMDSFDRASERDGPEDDGPSPISERWFDFVGIDPEPWYAPKPPKAGLMTLEPEE